MLPFLKTKKSPHSPTAIFECEDILDSKRH
nr:MAG TPA: hypothetical protein [Caudoviricetes sp.]